ncbi:sensor domain-containing protein [Mycobacterium sp. ML4]
MRFRWAAVITAAAVVAAGCAVDGTARPAPGLKPKPVIGEDIKQVLLDGAVLNRMLNQPFKSDANIPPRFGGPEKLQSGTGDISPIECAGVTMMTVKSAYDSARVANVARETWWAAGSSGKVIDVSEAVVALPTAADAGALFDQFAEQWNNCKGATVMISGGVLSYTDEVADVRVDSSLLAATVYMQVNGDSGGRRPEARAIGIRVNCLIEVEVSFFGGQLPPDSGTADVNSTATDIARAMMDRVSARS